MNPALLDGVERIPFWVLVGIAVIVDFITILLCSVASSFVLGYEPLSASADASNDWLKLAIIVCLFWVLVVWRLGGYSRRLWNSGVELYALVLRSAPIAFSVSLVLAFFVAKDVGGFYIIVFLSMTVACVLIERWALRAAVHAMHRRGRLISRVTLIGGSQEIDSVVRRLVAPNFSGMEVVNTIVREPNGYWCSGQVSSTCLDDLHPAIVESDASYVIFCGDSPSVEELDALCWRLREQRASVSLVVGTERGTLPSMTFKVASGLPLLEIDSPGLSASDRLLKRLFDAATSLSLIILLVPVFLVVSLLILVEDGRPIFFTQERVGLDGRKFGCVKFRSMYRDAASREVELRKLHHRPGQMWKVENDPRVTRVGRFIRASSVDELPQLFNVLKGDMSIVGPRPKQAWELADYSPTQLRRLSVKPGLTGLSQVSGRSDLSVDEATRLDLDYLQNWSIFRDLAICLRTIVVVSRGSGAY